MPLPAWIAFVAFALPLSWIDVRTHRLPNPLVAAFAAVMLASLTLAAAVGGAWGQLLQAVFAAIVASAAGLLLGFAGWIGMGDAKIAFPIGLTLGWFGWSALWLGIMVAFTLAAAVALVMIATKRRGWRSSLAFGPFLCVGVLIVGAFTWQSGGALGI